MNTENTSNTGSDSEFDIEKMETEDLQKTFEPIVGFLVTPKRNDKNRKAVSFEGIVDAVVTMKGNAKGKFKKAADQHWFILIATKDQECKVLDQETGEMQVKKGMRVGVSETAGTSALINKTGHWCRLEYTGKTIPTNSGDMLEVIGRVSKNPVVEQAPF